MGLIIFFLLANFVGLLALFVASVLCKREFASSPGRLVSRRGLGTLCVLAAGAALVLSAHYKLAVWITRWGTETWVYDSPVLPEVDFFNPKLTIFSVACLALLAVGAALLVFRGPAGVSQAAHGKGPFTWSVAVALIITLAELSIFLYYNQTAKVITKLPRLELDATGIQPNKTYKKKYQFSSDWFSEHIPIWEKALEGYKGKPNIHFLEVGLFEGRSALWVLENVLTHPTARLTGMDPFFSYYKKVFYSNLELSGLEEQARIIEGFSQIELRKLPLASYDIIYIDGSHQRADVLEDAILSWRLLKDGGILIFDDYLLQRATGDPATSTSPGFAIDTFFAYFSDHFEPVHVGWQVILKKKQKSRPSP
jgi:predicted O-methyltransferase YrrM